jgi:hypothetical protein
VRTQFTEFSLTTHFDTE